METLRIKHRDFEILDTLSESSFLLERKGKRYFARKFTPKSQEGEELTYAMRKLSTSENSSAPRMTKPLFMTRMLTVFSRCFAKKIETASIHIATTRSAVSSVIRCGWFLV